MAHLPAQLAEVDPIVASFCGGAVGVLSTLMLVEANNSKMQAAHRCIYCGVRFPFDSAEKHVLSLVWLSIVYSRSFALHIA